LTGSGATAIGGHRDHLERGSEWLETSSQAGRNRSCAGCWCHSPWIGGLITTAISWRAAFIFQALIIVIIIVLSRRAVQDPVPADPSKPFDSMGAVLSAAGLVVLATGIMLADNDLLLTAVFMAAGALLLFWFFTHVRAMERKGEQPLLSTGLFQNRTSNLVNLVQSSFPDELQGEISGLSRSVSNLGSSLGIAVGGRSSSPGRTVSR
jgi:hypothetical protein